MKDQFIIEYSFVNKDGATESFTDEREEWSMDIAIGRALRNARLTTLKGRRDVKELSITASKVEKERKHKNDSTEEETENWQGPICLVCGQPEDEDGRCECTNKDANGV